MRIRLLSDLHLEGFPFQYEYFGEDVIVLAGDIHTGNRHADFLDQIYEKTPTTNWEGETLYTPILMVAGNHEFYHGDVEETRTFLHGLSAVYPSFKFLHNSHATIGNISFFGGTMFTDFELDGAQERWFAEQDAKRFIADFAHIKTVGDHYEPRRWTVEDHKKEYELFNKEFDHWRANAKQNDPKIEKLVCISHFMPSAKSIDPQFAKSRLNPYFTANNEARVQQVDYWFHGHTHTSFDYMIEDTRVVCNPKGYGQENRNGFTADLIVEI